MCYKYLEYLSELSETCAPIPLKEVKKVIDSMIEKYSESHFISFEVNGDDPAIYVVEQ